MEPFTAALMLAVWFDATGVVVIVKVPVVAPAAIVAVPVTVAAVLLEVTVIGRPPAGAGLLIVIVPVEVAPPETEVGFSERVATVGAVRAKFAFADDALELAVMFAVAFAATGTVVTAKVPEVVPAGIVPVAGTVTAGLLERSATDRPPAGAAELIVIVPVEPTPPITVVGFKDSVNTVGPFTVRVAVGDVPFPVAVMVAGEFTLTATVVILKVADVCPTGIVTLAGTVTAAKLDVKAIGSAI